MKSEHYQHPVEHGEYTELASHNTLSHLFLDTLQYENSRYLYKHLYCLGSLGIYKYKGPEYIENRNTIGLSYIQTVRYNLTRDQSLILAGCFSGDNNIPIVISGDGSLPTPDATYKTCAMEADMRIWRHIAVVNAQKILANQYLPKDVIVQINVAHSRELRYVHIKNVLKVQEIDLDLASLPQNDKSAIIHMLFVVSGCDYISYFMGFGKGMFLNTFYQYAEFISGKNSTGYLCHITEDSKRKGFLSFLRLIGSLYFKKHYLL